MFLHFRVVHTHRAPADFDAVQYEVIVLPAYLPCIMRSLKKRDEKKLGDRKSRPISTLRGRRGQRASRQR